MKLTYHDLVQQLRETVPEVGPAELMANDAPARILIDIREPNELLTGMIPGSFHAPRGVLEGVISQISPDTDAEIVLICSGGNRSILAGASLVAMGFTKVRSLAGGTTAWRMAGGEIIVPGSQAAPEPPPLAVDAEARYARHLVLDGVGREGQLRLGAASVMIVGVGGLGSPVALYLAAAGVGRLGLVDPDVVDVSNLQRQVIHDTTKVGMRKVDSAADTIQRLNPGATLEVHPTRLDAGNALEILDGYDVIIDATDSFPTRYLINDAALGLHIPVVHGSVYRYEGQATVFDPYRGPCYRCLFPQAPPPELAPNCAEAGVLGVLPGTIGMIQATEAIKLILTLGESLAGRLLTYDARAARFDTLEIARNPECPACADADAPPTLVDYEDACLPGQ
jgi:sulfur-carrier protein adenylyltransferase/sulfurtransferase